MDRKRIARWVAPVAFLAAITIGALVVRAGLRQGQHHPNPATTTVASKKKKGHGHGQRNARQTYTIQSGDTLGSIAAKTGTSIARLQQLNPGIDPSALQVGDKIRVQ
jgi:LysM repeat protein